jgi:hypothetical protein
MDIEKFNNALKSKVALAKSYESKNEVASAIKIWLEVSEMTIKFSKSRNIDVSYKNMLINRTKSILVHIKNLKAGQVEKPLFEDEIFIHQEEILTDDSELEKNENQVNSVIDDDVKTVEDTDFTKIPSGFKEIQPKDFKIITPHDDNYVKKRINEVQDSNYFKQKNTSLPNNERFDFKQEANKGLICFACGYDNKKNAKTCKGCGTKLE